MSIFLTKRTFYACDIISVHKPGHRRFQFKLSSAEEIESKKKTKWESAERSQRGTPRKPTSPAGVNDSNLDDGKRKRRPEANDLRVIHNCYSVLFDDLNSAEKGPFVLKASTLYTLLPKANGLQNNSHTSQGHLQFVIQY